MSIYKTGLVALGIAVPALVAQSANAVGWKTKPMAEASSSEQIYTATSDNSSVALFCTDGKLKSAISTASNDAENIVEALMETRRRKTVDIDLYVDGEKVSASPWVLNPSTKVYVPKSARVAVKLYNAAVKGQAAAFKRSGHDMVELTLPAPNSDFVNFGSACGIGSKSYKTDS